MDIKRVLITDPVSEQMLCGLKEAHLEVDYEKEITPQMIVNVIANYDAVLIRSRTTITREIIEATNGALKLIVRAGVGVDNVDVEAASERGVLVINAPNGNTVSACELTCAHILNMSRKMHSAMSALKGGIWNRQDFVGIEVAEKTLGLIGLGRIGCAVAKRMKAFDMKVIGYDPWPAPHAEQYGIEVVSLEEVYKRSDIISLHVPLLPDTRHMINRTTLAECKHGVMIVNCARGGVVDEGALYEALVSKQVAAAALDVFELEPPNCTELLHLPNFYPTPHLGASTRDGQRRVGEEIVDEMIKLKNGQKIPGAVNASRLNIPFLK